MHTFGYRKLAGISLAVAVTLTGAAGTKGTNTSNGADSGSVLLDPNTKVTISVDCEPPATKKAERKQWLDDIAAFNKIYPNVTIKSKDASPCEQPAAFAAMLKAGT